MPLWSGYHDSRKLRRQSCLDQPKVHAPDTRNGTLLRKYQPMRIRYLPNNSNGNVSEACDSASRCGVWPDSADQAAVFKIATFKAPASSSTHNEKVTCRKNGNLNDVGRSGLVYSVSAFEKGITDS